MSRDSGSGDPSQRTVAELLAEHGGGGQRGSRRRRRRAEDPSETAPQAIIERVNSDSGRMLPVDAPEAEDASPSEHGTASGAETSASFGTAAQPPQTAPPPAAGASPEPQPGPTVDQPTRPSTDDSSPPSRRRVSGAGPRRPTRPGARSAEPAAQPEPGDEAGKWSTPAAESGTAASSAAATPPAAAPPPVAPTPPTAATPPTSATTNSAPPADDTETTAQQPPLPVRTPGTSGMSRKGPSAPSGDAPQWQEGQWQEGQWQDGTARTSDPDTWSAPAQDAPPLTGAVPDNPVPDSAVPDAVSPETPAPEPPPAREDATEQFPPVRGSSASAGDPEVTDGDGTALLEYPIPAESVGAEPIEVDRDETDDPHGTAYFDPYEGVDSEFGDSDAFYTGMVDDPYADSDDYVDEEDEYAAEQPPTGIPAEEYEADRETEYGERSALREWAILIAQTVAGLVGGGLVWIGFRWLWSELPLPALAAALAFTGTLVLVARKVLRTDDLQTILLSVLVGLVCTVSPVAFLLLGY
ncbi:hypothetical protein SAMN04487819_105242 [Actinopolyspora alba]|uniref:Uncharacterized protein n=1 Tax=Actinopolyspora alba TaxID=673379 RepID=A0A1I1WLD9_9ACTN|nr:hypothetical protein [Actinopolyspora alba]SFD94223.1 hypothetical protein SAMN04487819_105242 [Actinopolyspora alba]